MKEIFNLKNKTFIVVGASGRLGKLVASELIKSGSKVIAVDRDQEGIDKEKSLFDPSSYQPLTGDVNDEKFISHIFQYVREKNISINGAVNLAYPKNENYGKHFFDVSYEDFCENVSLHLGAYFLFMQQCAKYSITHEIEFSLVNFSSIYGVIAPKFNIYKNTEMTVPVEYAAIKSSIQHISTYVSSYTKGSKFRVNCISPGGILDNQDSVFLKNYNNIARSKGMLDAVDIIGTVLYLCSDASKFVVGQNIVVDDGFSI